LRRAVAAAASGKAHHAQAHQNRGAKCDVKKWAQRMLSLHGGHLSSVDLGASHGSSFDILSRSRHDLQKAPPRRAITRRRSSCASSHRRRRSFAR
jgi:hypothetical protein